jgi:hypothetical protein
MEPTGTALREGDTHAVMKGAAFGRQRRQSRCGHCHVHMRLVHMRLVPLRIAFPAPTASATETAVPVSIDFAMIVPPSWCNAAWACSALYHIRIRTIWRHIGRGRITAVTGRRRQFRAGVRTAKRITDIALRSFVSRAGYG